MPSINVTLSHIDLPREKKAVSERARTRFSLESDPSLFIHLPSPSLSLISSIHSSSSSSSSSSSVCKEEARQMGNCQAVDAAALVIQHPCGKIERLYWPVTASEVMRANPGHYVSLIIPLQVSEQQNQDQNTVRITQVKLLRPNETLTLGHAYRLITTQEVVKVVRAKKHARTRKAQAESVQEKDSSASEAEGENSQTGKEYHYQAMRMRAERQRVGVNSGGAVRSKSWRPSLQSISESGSSLVKSCDTPSGSHNTI